jgi:hypothetical protein
MKNLRQALIIAFGLIVGTVCAAEARHSNAHIVQKTTAGFAANGGLRPEVWRTPCAATVTV